MARSRGAWIAAGIAGLLVAGAATAASAAGGSTPVTVPHWHFVFKAPKTAANVEFTAVVATGKTTAMAFGFSSPGGENAWQRTGGVWKKIAFPGKGNEFVGTAGATSPSDVWAFSDSAFGTTSRVLSWNGSKWTPMRTFGGSIMAATVLGPKDVWVFGGMGFGTPAIGVWHYNGHTWQQIGKNMEGGSALSDHDVWAFTATSVAHWNGSKWTLTSVKSLLPKVQPTHLNDPQVTGILALSPTSVFALGNGNQQDEGGPLVVLHFDGHKWSKLAQGNFGFGPGVPGGGPGPQFSYDGNGGLWIPMTGGSGATDFLLRYSKLKLTPAVLPVNPATLTIAAVSRIPGTNQQLAAGFSHAAHNRGVNPDAVILQYS
jgi:hypothetical protein